jgi:hypothetical protein
MKTLENFIVVRELYIARQRYCNYYLMPFFLKLTNSQKIILNLASSLTAYNRAISYHSMVFTQVER